MDIYFSINALFKGIDYIPIMLNIEIPSEAKIFLELQYRRKLLPVPQSNAIFDDCVHTHWIGLAFFSQGNGLYTHINHKDMKPHIEHNKALLVKIKKIHRMLY